MAIQVPPIAGILGLDTDPFAKGMLRAESIMRLFPATVQNFLASPLLGFVGLAQTAITSVGSAIGSLVGTGLRLAADFEQAEISMTTMLGSAELAQRTLGELSDFAAKTPFQFPEIVSAATSLLAFNTNAEELIPTLRMIGDISAGLPGLGFNELAVIFGKARIENRIMGQELNQLAGRGIPVIQEFAKQLGVSEGEVRKLAETGVIGFENLRQAFEDLTGPGGKFAGLMEAQSKSIKGLFSTLKDNVNLTLRDVGLQVAERINLQGIFETVIREVERARPQIAELTESLLQALPDIAEALRGLIPVLQEVLSLAMKIADYIPTYSDQFGLTNPQARMGRPNQRAMVAEGIQLTAQEVIAGGSTSIAGLMAAERQIGLARTEVLNELEQIRDARSKSGLHIGGPLNQDQRKLAEQLLGRMDSLFAGRHLEVLAGARIRLERGEAVSPEEIEPALVAVKDFAGAVGDAQALIRQVAAQLEGRGIEGIAEEFRQGMAASVPLMDTSRRQIDDLSRAFRELQRQADETTRGLSDLADVAGGGGGATTQPTTQPASVVLEMNGDIKLDNLDVSQASSEMAGIINQALRRHVENQMTLVRSASRAASMRGGI